MSDTNDFVVSTLNRCFLCLSEVKQSFSPDHDYICKSSSFATHSIQHLAKFLNLDRSKVFLEDLGEKVEQSPMLMVVLCEECAPLNKSLSELFQQLERIRQEVMAKLTLVQGKLLKVMEVSPDVRDDRVNTKVCDDSNPNSLKGKMELAERLRKNVIEKCAAKLSLAESPVKLEDLLPNDNEVPSATHASPHQKVIVEQPSQIWSIPPEESGLRIVKVESLNTGNDEGPVQGSSLVVASPTQIIHLESGSDLSPDLPANFMEEEEEEEEQEIFLADDLQAEQQDQDIPLDLTTTAPAVAPVPSNSGDPGDAQIKYQCESCHKSFTTPSSCRIHYETAHLGVRYKCPGLGCTKSFSQRSHLQFHQRHSCGRRGHRSNCYCDLCGKGLANRNNLHSHLRLIHSRIRDLPCDHCEKMFYMEHEVIEHQRKKHGMM